MTRTTTFSGCSAVDEPVALTGLPSYQDVQAAVTEHTLGEARLIGTYQR